MDRKKERIFYDEDGVPTDYVLDMEYHEHYAFDGALRGMLRYFFPSKKVKCISWDFINKHEVVIKFENDE